MPNKKTPQKTAPAPTKNIDRAGASDLSSKPLECDSVDAPKQRKKRATPPKTTQGVAKQTESAPLTAKPNTSKKSRVSKASKDPKSAVVDKEEKVAPTSPTRRVPTKIISVEAPKEPKKRTPRPKSTQSLQKLVENAPVAAKPKIVKKSSSIESPIGVVSSNVEQEEIAPASPTRKTSKKNRKSEKPNLSVAKPISISAERAEKTTAQSTPIPAPKAAALPPPKTAKAKKLSVKRPVAPPLDAKAPPPATPLPKQAKAQKKSTRRRPKAPLAPLPLQPKPELPHASKKSHANKTETAKAPVTTEQPILDANSKRFENILKATKQLISGRGYVPLSLQELINKLSLPAQHRDLFSDIMQQLVKEKFVVMQRGKFALTEDPVEIVTGILHMNPRGFGFVTAEAEFHYTADIFIPKHLTLNAVDGDTVEVVINGDAISDKGPEGKIVSVITRSRTHIAGIVNYITHKGEAQAYVPLLGLSQRVGIEPQSEFALKVGDRLVLEVVDWGSKTSSTLCRLSHYLGHISDPSCDVAAALEEFELRADFPHKALEQAKSFGTQIPKHEIAHREDLREQETFTIDPTTAKDFDDALSLQKDASGHYHLIVHIADVSHYVQEGSPLDKEAALRCNSTYFPGYCLPMLPPMLSENLCSLKEMVNRLTVSVFMEFDAQGNLLNSRIARTVIKSNKRMTYEQAKEILDGKKRSKHAPTLHLMVELCLLLKAKRQQRGSIEFSLPDLIITLDETGQPTGTKSISYDITHQLVEEFMLKANELVAIHLNKAEKGVAYRIHDEPSKENMKDFAMLASSFGFFLSDDPTPQELQLFFTEAVNSPYGQYLAINYIKRMKQAQYSPENIGHYGLSLTHYCHFTSPIRRYIDLLIHRTLFSNSTDSATLEKVTHSCTEQERVSAKAENSVLLLKKLRLLNKQYTEAPKKVYEAIITRVKNFGFSFELLELLMEGFMHVSELSEDYFIFDEKGHRLEGRHTGKIYTSGERIQVVPKEIDFILLETRWQLAGNRTFRKSHKRPRNPKRRR